MMEESFRDQLGVAVSIIIPDRDAKVLSLGGMRSTILVPVS